MLIKCALSVEEVEILWLWFFKGVAGQAFILRHYVDTFGAAKLLILLLFGII